MMPLIRTRCFLSASQASVHCDNLDNHAHIDNSTCVLESRDSETIEARASSKIVKLYLQEILTS